MAREAGYTAVMSHRSGETEDDDDRRPRRRHRLRPDQDRRPVALGPRGEVQPAAAHRGGRSAPTPTYPGPLRLPLADATRAALEGTPPGGAKGSWMAQAVSASAQRAAARRRQRKAAPRPPKGALGHPLGPGCARGAARDARDRPAALRLAARALDDPAPGRHSAAIRPARPAERRTQQLRTQISDASLAIRPRARGPQARHDKPRRAGLRRRKSSQELDGPR